MLISVLNCEIRPRREGSPTRRNLVGCNSSSVIVLRVMTHRYLGMMVKDMIMRMRMRMKMKTIIKMKMKKGIVMMSQMVLNRSLGSMHPRGRWRRRKKGRGRMNLRSHLSSCLLIPKLRRKSMGGS